MMTDMIYSAGFLLALTAFLAPHAFCKKKDLGDIVYSIITYRHGVRAPARLYPNDPYQDMSLWPNGFGELTEEGMNNHFELGKWLRKRYYKLLPANYNKSDIYIRSTDVDRTLMSAYCNLAGLYEPDPSKNWNDNIQWRPIPVHTEPEHINTLAMLQDCPRYNELLEELLATPYFQRLMEDYQVVFDGLSEGTGVPTVDRWESVYIFDTLFIEEYHGLELPPWTKKYYPEPLVSMVDQIFGFDSFTQELARLKSGPVISEMLNSMENKITNNATEKVRVYSAHDLTIVNIMQALRVYNWIRPPFTAALLIELRKIDDYHFVTVSYKNETHAEPHLLTLPGCTALCPWQHFKLLLQPVIPVDWEMECIASGGPNTLSNEDFFLNNFIQYKMTDPDWKA